MTRAALALTLVAGCACPEAEVVRAVQTRVVEVPVIVPTPVPIPCPRCATSIPILEAEDPPPETSTGAIDDFGGRPTTTRSDRAWTFTWERRP